MMCSSTAALVRDIIKSEQKIQDSLLAHKKTPIDKEVIDTAIRAHKHSIEELVTSLKISIDEFYKMWKRYD